MVSGSFNSGPSGSFHRSLALLIRYRSLRSISPWRVVPPDSHQVSRARCYSGYRRIRTTSSTGLSPSVDGRSRPHSYRLFSSLRGPTTPATFACHRFRLFPFRSPLLWESRLIPFPVGTEMCHFPTFAGRASMDSKRANPDYSGLGFPIRRSRDQLVCSSPGLIAAYHVLPRLSAPRHPPYTLSNLTALIPLPELRSSVNVQMCVASRRHGWAALENLIHGSTVQQRHATLFPFDFQTPLLQLSKNALQTVPLVW